MKKIICAMGIAAILAAGVAPVAVASDSSVAVSASATASSSVRIYSFVGNMKHSNSATVETDSNGVYVTYQGTTYTARYSNRSGYDYMFTDKKGKTWYFNL